MKFSWPKIKIAAKDWVFVAVMAVLCVVFWLIPPVDSPIRQTGRTVPAEVLETNDSMLMEMGVEHYGSQYLQVKILDGEFEGKVFPAVNELRGEMDLDKIFVPGDRITVVVTDDVVPEESLLLAKDYDRFPWSMVLFAGFCLLLIVFGAWTGAKALFSFIFSCLVIFKVIIPLTLKGYSASWMIFGCVALLTAVIVFLVAGLNRKGVVAFAGSVAGVLSALIMSHIFTGLLHINGATLHGARALLYNIDVPLDLADIFTGAIILACSGAVMDLAMDIASAIEEVSIHNKNLTFAELTASGMRVGRSVVGTMTTTLLLAYSGGYLTTLMMFAWQGTNPVDVVNNPIVAAEIVKTLIGSFSLVLVAPLTAIVGGWFFRCRAA